MTGAYGAVRCIGCRHSGFGAKILIHVPKIRKYRRLILAGKFELPIVPSLVADRTACWAPALARISKYVLKF